MNLRKLTLIAAAALLLLFLSPAALAADVGEAVLLDLEDGEYAVGVDIVGGSGKAFVSSPALMTVENGRARALLIWSSENYDYMIVSGKKYLNLAEEGANSRFDIPIPAMDVPIEVVGDTTAMGTPYEIRYQLTFHSDAIDSKSALPQEAAKRVAYMAAIIIVGGGILNYFFKRRHRG